jgi:hypothetical protein
MKMLCSCAAFCETFRPCVPVLIKRLVLWFVVCFSIPFLTISPLSAESIDSVKIVRFGKTTLYIPSEWEINFFTPPYGKTPPNPVDVNINGSFELYTRHNLLTPTLRRPELPKEFEPYRFVFKGYPPNAEPFSKRYPNGTLPDGPRNCDPNDYGKQKEKVFGYCHYSREAMDEVDVKYEWSGLEVDPSAWKTMDQRVQDMINWLATPPDKRPPTVRSSHE